MMFHEMGCMHLSRASKKPETEAISNGLRKQGPHSKNYCQALDNLRSALDCFRKSKQLSRTENFVEPISLIPQTVDSLVPCSLDYQRKSWVSGKID